MLNEISDRYKEKIEHLIKKVKNVSDKPINRPQDLGKVYEAYCMVRMIQALSAKKIEIINSEGSVLPNGPFIYRGAPGYLASGSKPKAERAGAIRITLQYERYEAVLEIHNSVCWNGLSGVAHEVDIAIVPKNEIDSIRHSDEPISANILLSIECKHRKNYKDILGPDLARELIGYMIEFPSTAVHLITNANEEDCMSQLAVHYRNSRFIEQTRAAFSGVDIEMKIRNAVLLKLAGHGMFWYSSNFDHSHDHSTLKESADSLKTVNATLYQIKL